MTKRYLGVSGRSRSTAQTQWAPTLTSHDPNPPISLETGAVPDSGPISVSAHALSNPVVRKQSGYVYQPVNLLTTTLAVVVSLVARDPLVAHRPTAKKVQQPTEVTNLLTNTLGTPAVSLPKNQYDWTNPVRGKRVQQPDVLPWLTSRAPVAESPAKPVDWGRVPPKRLAAQQYTLINATILQPEVAEYIVLPGVSDGVYPRRYPQHIAYQNLLTSTLAPQQSPVIPADWSISTRRPAAQQPYIFPSFTSEPPARQAEWLNPVLKVSPRQPELINLTVLLPPGVEQAPFTQADWPNPVIERVAQQPDVLLNPTLTTLSLAPQIPPPNQYDWPNPTLPTPIVWHFEHQIPTGFLPPTVAPPVVEPVAPDGGSAKRPHRKRFYVEIDGQYFEVDSQAEAEEKLIQALTLAQEVVAPQAVEHSFKRIRRGKKAATPQAPIMSSSPEVASVVEEYRDRIEAVYRRIAVDAELRALMRAKMLDEDDEEAIMVLLH